jgi:hypothetical protein
MIGVQILLKNDDIAHRLVRTPYCSIDGAGKPATPLNLSQAHMRRLNSAIRQILV